MQSVTTSPDDDNGDGLRQVITEQQTAMTGHPESNSVPDILHAIRTHLKMDVAFVSEFVGGRRVFRYVDSDWKGNPVQVGNGDALEDSYCQRVIDGRLPELIHDARENAVAAELSATFDIPVGAHMGVPIHLSDGSVYGTFCCFSRTSDMSLNQRDLALMRVFAELTGKMIDRERAFSMTLISSRERIRQILTGNLLSMVYQPIFDLHGGHVTGFESLARFTATPLRSPDLWFNEAHEAGLGIELELRAIEIALAALPHFNEGMDLAVNASPDTVLDHRLARMLDSLPSLEHVVLEITEHSAVERYEAIGARLKAYRDRGLRIAVDDAGAGYASFRHILNLGPDRIKLDMSLTRDINADPARRALAAALIHFSSDTGSQLIAEGVETAAEVATLMELGVKKAQGYFLGRPMSLQGLVHTGALQAPAIMLVHH